MGKHPKFVFSVFTFDTETGALLRNARRLRIPHQSARLLEFLLTRTDSLVTREELQHVLWPDGEFLDYDQGINKAINRLREILRDDPKEPRFLETVPKRGYRFIAKVKLAAENDAAEAEAAHSVDEIILPAESAILPPLANDAPEQREAPLKIQPIWPELVVQTDQVHRSYAGAARVRSVRRLYLYGAVITAVLVIAAVGVQFAIHAKRSSTRNRAVEIGIMPFQAESLEATRLAESFRLDIVGALSQLPGVQVRSPLVMVDASNNSGIQTLAKESDLDMLLMGSLVRSGDQYLLQLELVRSGDANHLASFQYTGSREELAAISKRVQRDFFGYLNSGSEAAQVVNGSTQDRVAYGDYLQGKYYSSEASLESATRAIESYKAALARDPNFALAYAGMAHAYVSMNDFSDSPNKCLDKAKELAGEALRRNPRIAEAHAVLGFASFLRDWDASVGEKEIRTAIQLDSDQALYHNLLSVILSDQGRFEESLHEIDLAHTADPTWDGAYETESYLASAARQTSRAIKATQKYLNLRPNWPPAHDSMAWSLFGAGQYPQAIAEWRRMAVLEKDESRARLEDEGLTAFRRGGIRAYARVRLAASLIASKAEPHRNDFVLAEWYAFAGEKDKAIAALQEVVAHHDPLSLQLAVDPMYDSLHHDPRYLALLTRVGLSLPSPA